MSVRFWRVLTTRKRLFTGFSVLLSVISCFIFLTGSAAALSTGYYWSSYAYCWINTGVPAKVSIQAYYYHNASNNTNKVQGYAFYTTPSTTISRFTEDAWADYPYPEGYSLGSTSTNPNASHTTRTNLGSYYAANGTGQTLGIFRAWEPNGSSSATCYTEADF